MVDRLPIGFQRLCRTAVVSVDFLHVLARVDLAMSYKSSRKIPYNQRRGAHDDYLAVSSLQDFYGLENDGKNSSGQLEALLALGVLLFSSTAYNEMRATPVLFREPRDALYERLLLGSDAKISGISGIAEDECYQWIWCVAADSWRDASRELLPQGHQLLAKFHNRYASRWANPQDLVVLLQRFCWTDDLINFHIRSYGCFKAKRP